MKLQEQFRKNHPIREDVLPSLEFAEVQCYEYTYFKEHKPHKKTLETYLTHKGGVDQTLMK